MQQEDGKRGARMGPISTMPPNTHYEASPAAVADAGQAYAALAKNLETLLEAARPRLLSLTYLQGIPPEAAEDVVQETLVTAWRQLATLRAPERFDSWLAGICRNHCRMHARSTKATRAHLTAVGASSQGETSEATPSLDDFCDPLACDPSEAMDREALETLVDQAMGYLPKSARGALELCYLRELPQREAALRLGMTIGALEVQLHRARRQLRQILSTTLRAEAESFGLSLDDELPTGWRETREWCHQCARRHMLGIFEMMPNGRINFRLQCPDCSTRYQADIHSSVGLVPFDGVHSIKPALKRTLLGVNARYAEALVTGQQQCDNCGATLRAYPAPPHEQRTSLPRQRAVVLECPRCDFSHATGLVGVACLTDPTVRPLVMRFIQTHPRWVIEPDHPVEHDGVEALSCGLSDATSGKRLTALVDPQRVRVLRVFSN